MMKRKDLMIVSLLVLVVLLLTFKVVSFGDALTPPNKGDIIVYGSKTCPWCVKQEKYLIDNGLPYTFVDCKQGQCPDFVSGFPTLLVDNVVKVGYNEVLKKVLVATRTVWAHLFAMGLTMIRKSLSMPVAGSVTVSVTVFGKIAT